MAVKDKKQRDQQKTDGINVKLVNVRRTTKVVKGGRIFSFSALVVVGDGKGKVGYAIGRAKEVPIAVQKAEQAARREMTTIELTDGTIWHEVYATYISSKILMKPAPKGTGIIAGNSMRAVFEVIGVQNILAKCIGSTNPLNVVAATIKGLRGMVTPTDVAMKRGLSIKEVTGRVNDEKN